MLDRIAVAIGLVILGIAAYRLLLLAQQRTVSRRAQSGERVERATLLVFTSPTCAPCKLQQVPIINRLLFGVRIRPMFWLAVAVSLVGLYLLSSLFFYIQGYIMSGIAMKVTYIFRKNISEKINRMPLKYFDTRTH